MSSNCLRNGEPDSDSRLAKNSGLNPQRVLNGEIHAWYRMRLGYSDHLVSKLLDEFKVGAHQTVLDPFCGAGTTLVECKKRNIPVVGIDANPACQFASKVKTKWNINSQRLLFYLSDIETLYRSILKNKNEKLITDPTFIYLEACGMLRRGWICKKPLKKSLAIKRAIRTLGFPKAYRDVLMLALVSTVLEKASNVKFGPELYCSERKRDHSVFSSFAAQVKLMAQDLEKARMVGSESECQVFLGDSRDCKDMLKLKAPGPYSAIICSPPYPAEHDYTRNSRLELAFLEHVSDRLSLQAIKKNMIRCNTKGIYVGDSDRELVSKFENIASIVRRVNRKARYKEHGFARLYSAVILEYFGGMKRHLMEMRSFLDAGARCAYVVGDQSNYLQVSIPTATILGEIAETIGYKVARIELWRERHSSTTSKTLAENILVLEKDNRRL